MLSEQEINSSCTWASVSPLSLSPEHGDLLQLQGRENTTDAGCGQQGHQPTKAPAAKALATPRKRTSHREEKTLHRVAADSEGDGPRTTAATGNHERKKISKARKQIQQHTKKINPPFVPLRPPSYRGRPDASHRRSFFKKKTPSRNLHTIACIMPSVTPMRSLYT